MVNTNEVNLEKAPDGRYVLARRVEEYVPKVESRLKEEAGRKGVELFVIAALEVITDPEEVRLFQERAYPLEIAKKKFGGSYPVLERMALDSVYGFEKVAASGLGKIGMTPIGAARKNIIEAYGRVYMPLFKKEAAERLREIRQLWKLK